MLFLGSFVFVVAVCLFLLFWHARQVWNARLAEHKARVRRVHGCIECGSVIDPESFLFRCGVCKEDTTLCVSCFHSDCDFVKKHEHRGQWHRDFVNMEVQWRPPVPLTLPNVVREAFWQWKERPLLQTAGSDKWMSYEEVGLKVAGIVKRLHKLGLRAGDRVLLNTQSIPSFYLLQWACFRSALVAVPLSSDSPEDHVRAVVRLCEPRLVFSTSGRVVWEANHSFILWTKEEDVLAVREASPWWSPPIPCPGPDDLAMLLPTSGTTGVPKLVMFTDQMMTRAAALGTKQGNDMVLLAYQNLRQANEKRLFVV
jgi:hypothetical protein